MVGDRSCATWRRRPTSSAPTRASGANGNNIVQRNIISGSVNHDCHDTASGTGPAGSANTWDSDTATTQNVANLCFSGGANGVAD